MAEYIEREALILAFNLSAERSGDVDCPWDMSAIETEIEAAPAADVAPVVHGKWVFPTVIGGYAWDIPHCSVCEGVPCGTDENTKYCAICGARMDGE